MPSGFCVVRTVFEDSVSRRNCPPAKLHTCEHLTGRCCKLQAHAQRCVVSSSQDGALIDDSQSHDQPAAALPQAPVLPANHQASGGFATVESACHSCDGALHCRLCSTAHVRCQHSSGTRSMCCRWVETACLCTCTPFAKLKTCDSVLHHAWGTRCSPALSQLGCVGERTHT